MRVLFAQNNAQQGLNLLDVRVKLGITFSCAILSIACSSLAAQFILFGATLIYVLTLRRPILLLGLYALTTLMMMIAHLCAWCMSHFLPQMGNVAWQSLLIPFLRACCMMNVVLVLSLSTKVEHLLCSLERMHLPFCVFLPTAVMLRFIPTFTKDIQQIWETLKIKGYPLGAALFIGHPLLSIRLILIPILFRALKTAESLGVAAELKGLGYFDCVLCEQLKPLSRLDLIWISVALGVFFSTVLAEFFLKNWLMVRAISMP